MRASNLLIVFVMLFISGCLDVTATERVPATVPNPTVANLFPTVTPLPATETPVVNSTLPPTDIVSGRPVLAWQTDAVEAPIALGGAVERLAVLSANGIFYWVDGRTGTIQAETVLWENPQPNATRGELIVEGSLAILAIRERTTNIESGLVEQRAKLVVIDGEGNPVWELDELTDGRTYSVGISGGTLLVGTAPRGFEDNGISGYELFTGGELWRTDDTTVTDTPISPTPDGTPLTSPTPQPPSGYPQVRTAGGLGVAIIHDGGGGSMMAFSPNNGDVLWLERSLSDERLEWFTIINLKVVALSQSEIVFLNAEAGQQLAIVPLATDIPVGAALIQNVTAVAPAPTDTLTRPGIVGISPDGTLQWHSLIGLRATSLTAGQTAVWATLIDFDEGTLNLSMLNADDGLEMARIPVSDATDALNAVHVVGRRVYVLADNLYAFDY